VKTGRSSGAVVVIVLGLIMTGCATTMAPKTPTAAISTADIAGRWEGTWIARPGEGYSGRDSVMLNLTQNGVEVAGSIEMTNFSGPVKGKLAGNTLTFTSPGSPLDATLTVKENHMSGDFARPVGRGSWGDVQLTRKK
jgi:hypothetical protein